MQNTHGSQSLAKALAEVDNKFSEIGTKMADFKIQGELGKGSYGTVYKVFSEKDKKIYVLKKINMKHMKVKN